MNGASAGTDYTQDFSITAVNAVPTYGVSIGAFTGGTVTADKTANIAAGETVTLTVTPANHYELYHISVHKTGDAAITVQTWHAASLQYTFTMPAYGVTVTATFRKTADQTAVETAQSLIESLTCTVAQATANTQATVRTWLAARINALYGMSATGITVTAGDITVRNFHAAAAGTAGNPSGVNGSFNFSVSLSKGSSSLTASNSGTITATGYVAPATYAVTVESSANGTVTANPAIATAGTTVSLTLTPTGGYELETITVYRTGAESTTVETRRATSLQYTFTMPAYNVTVRATFRKTQAQLDSEAVDAAKAAIEGGTYRIAQATGNTEATVKTWLIHTLNVLFSQSSGIQIRSASTETVTDAEVGITSLTPAIAGTETTPAGTDGAFRFTVTLTQGQATAVTAGTPGVIIATPHATTPVKRIELLSLGGTTVRILNTGNVETGDLTLTLTGDHADAFTLSPAVPGSLPAGGETDITLTHNAGLASGSYALTLTAGADGLTPVSISITYTVMPTGTESIESPTLRVIATGNGFRITGLIPDKTLSVYNIQGQLLHKSKANATEQRVPLHVRGLYIVVNGERTVKAMY